MAYSKSKRYDHPLTRGYSGFHPGKMAPPEHEIYLDCM